MLYVMTTETIIESISHLYKAIDLVVDVNNKIIDDQILKVDLLVGNLSEAQVEVNNCRIYTQFIVDIEELLIPSMGLINDAKCMLESLVVWKLGMTLYGKFNIIKCLREAALENINPAIEELEYLLDQEVSSNDFIQYVKF